MSILRKNSVGYAHWCPGCEESHVIPHGGPNGWGFNGDLERPSFTPSVKITYNGADAGTENAPQACCHYFLTDGQLQFCSDSTHALAGKTVPLPAFPGAPSSGTGSAE